MRLACPFAPRRGARRAGSGCRSGYRFVFGPQLLDTAFEPACSDRIRHELTFMGLNFCQG